MRYSSLVTDNGTVWASNKTTYGTSASTRL